MAKKIVNGDEKISIDFPQSEERIASSHYAFRIDARVAGTVEVSVDGDEWRPCRPAGGYWWYDFHGEEAGRHTVTARVLTPVGEIETAPRRFRVEEPVGQAAAR